MNVATVRGGTVLFELLRSLERAGEYNAQDQTGPAAILWTDGDRQWEPLAPRLREAQHVRLNEFNPMMNRHRVGWHVRLVIKAEDGRL